MQIKFFKRVVPLKGWEKKRSHGMSLVGFKTSPMPDFVYWHTIS